MPPRSPARCTAYLPRVTSAGSRKRLERCLDERRPVEEVAAELRDYGATWRAIAYSVVGERTTDSWELANAAARQVDYLADVELMALGLEVAEKLCRWCAGRKAEAWLLLRKLVFVGLLAQLTGRDERAEEEFSLGAVA